ncbi:MAG: SMC-Scp complex subunit ScpB [Holophagaceae bacterium]|nr:SMC-Scp complex subunit ScpB [Holophagaceae bacterium]
MTETIFYQEPKWQDGGNLLGALEALFSATGEILTMDRLRELTGLGEGVIRQGIEALQERYQPPKGVRLLEVGGGWRLSIAIEYTDLVSKLVTTLRKGRLTSAQRDILALIAYRQPITIPEINEFRGVTSTSHQIKSLLDRELIMPVGRKHVVGRPMMYATTTGFLLRFGLRDLQDLPKLADFGESNLEANALTQIEKTLPNDGLFTGNS